MVANKSKIFMNKREGILIIGAYIQTRAAKSRPLLSSVTLGWMRAVPKLSCRAQKRCLHFRSAYCFNNDLKSFPDNMHIYILLN